MRTGSLPRGPAWLAVLLLAASTGGAAARTLSLEAARLVDPRAQAAQLRIELQEGEGASTLHLSAARLEVPLLRLSGELDWHCPLRRDPDGRRACSGPVRVGDKVAELAVGIDAVDAVLELRQGTAQVSLVLPFADSATTIGVRQLPIAWLEPVLDAYWPAGEVRRGVLDGSRALTHRGWSTPALPRVDSR